jgi:hypothetical protein
MQYITPVCYFSFDTSKFESILLLHVLMLTVHVVRQSLQTGRPYTCLHVQ